MPGPGSSAVAVKPKRSTCATTDAIDTATTSRTTNVAVGGSARVRTWPAPPLPAPISRRRERYPPVTMLTRGPSTGAGGHVRAEVRQPDREPLVGELGRPAVPIVVGAVEGGP